MVPTQALRRHGLHPEAVSRCISSVEGLSSHECRRMSPISRRANFVEPQRLTTHGSAGWIRWNGSDFPHLEGLTLGPRARGPTSDRRHNGTRAETPGSCHDSNGDEWSASDLMYVQGDQVSRVPHGSPVHHHQIVRGADLPSGSVRRGHLSFTELKTSTVPSTSMEGCTLRFPSPPTKGAVGSVEGSPSNFAAQVSINRSGTPRRTCGDRSAVPSRRP